MKTVPSEDDIERCASAIISQKGFHFASIFA